MGMTLHFDGREWLYDPQKVTVAAAMVIKDSTGMGLKSWGRAIDDWDPKAAQLLAWVIKGQNGVVCEPASIDFAGTSLSEFMAEVERAAGEWVADRIRAEAAKAKQPGKGSGRATGRRTPKKTPTSATSATATSSSSPTSAT